MSTRRAEPFLLIAGFVAILGLVRLASERVPGLQRLQQPEWITYDWRVRLAKVPRGSVRKLDVAFVAADDSSLEELTRGVLLGESFGLLWARQL